MQSEKNRETKLKNVNLTYNDDKVYQQSNTDFDKN